ncbi:MAG: nucleotidyltransferase family protein [Candidatus Binatia bacterium]
MTLPATAPSYMALMVSRRCNMSCGHCSVESDPHVKGEPSETELVDYVRQAAVAGVRSLQITGGEPMLREKIVLRLIRECKKLGISPVMTTNGFWGKSLSGARRKLKALRRAGLNALTVSYDRYHAEFQGPQAVLHIAQAAEEQIFSVNINIVRVADESDLPQLVAPFSGKPGVRLRFYDVQPVGRARALPLESLRGEEEGFCGAAFFPAITDDGRMTVCNGPSYFEKPESPLIVGSLRSASLRELFTRHQQDPVLDTIRTFGPSRLREELRKTPGFENFPFRKQYQGLCDLCLHLTSNAEVVQTLRARLAHPQLAAERFATRQVIEENRKAGALSRAYVNGIGACRTFLKAARSPAGDWGRQEARILGRADFDWEHQAEYLSRCGLARPLLNALAHSVMTRWAPAFFLHRLKAKAIREGFRELVQREALRRIAETLREVGGQGVLLKGAARLALAGEADESSFVRAAGDLDVYIDPAIAADVRRRLLAAGWQGETDGMLPATHHLAPVMFQGVALEIHTRIMPAFWGLPETDMLAHARPVPGMEPFATLDPEGFLLHTGIHVSTHLFALGLKTAWDILWVLERCDEIDWERLARWVKMLRVPRGFWTPVRVLCRELDLAMPQEFLRRSPADAHQRRLDVIARHRLFHIFDGPEALNPVSRIAIFLLLHDSWLGRARYLASWCRGRTVKAQGDMRRVATGNDLTVLKQSLREVLLHWRQYRRALARDL